MNNPCSKWPIPRNTYPRTNPYLLLIKRLRYLKQLTCKGISLSLKFVLWFLSKNPHLEQQNAKITYIQQEALQINTNPSSQLEYGKPNSSKLTNKLVSNNSHSTSITGEPPTLILVEMVLMGHAIFFTIMLNGRKMVMFLHNSHYRAQLISIGITFQWIIIWTTYGWTIFSNQLHQIYVQIQP